MNYTFTTKNLVIRSLDEKNVSMVLDFYERNKDFFEPFEADKPDIFYTKAYQQKVLNCERINEANSSWMRLFIFKKDDPSYIIGTVSFSSIIRGYYNHAVIGYKIDKAYARKGYGTEAVSACIDIACKRFGIHRLEAYIMTDNIASICFIEKMNFVKEGIAKDFLKKGDAYIDMIRFVHIYNEENNYTAYTMSR